MQPFVIFLRCTSLWIFRLLCWLCASSLQYSNPTIILISLTSAYTWSLESCVEKCMFKPFSLYFESYFHWMFSLDNRVLNSCLLFLLNFTFHFTSLTLILKGFMMLTHSWAWFLWFVYITFIIPNFEFCSYWWSWVKVLIRLMIRVNSFIKTTFYFLKTILIELVLKLINW